MISRGYGGIPPCAGGQRIGLFGGSFNPPHDGHRQASLLALRRLQLDWTWWLVTPGNPPKDTRDLPSILSRMTAARRLAAHPRIVVTALEAKLGLRYTCDVASALRRRRPTARFVLIIGADSFADLHCWKNWRRIVATLPLAVVDRPGHTLKAPMSRAAIEPAIVRLPETQGRRLAETPPPVYVFLHGPRSQLSSTEIRHERDAS